MNVGIIGTGLIGKKRAEAIKKLKDKLVAVADIDTEKARLLAKEYSCNFTSRWQELVERRDIDIIVVATPSNLLYKISLAALKAKKHVLCEKPLGRNFNEASRLYRAAQSSGVLLKTGFNHRFHPAITKAYSLLNAGKIGETMYIRSIYGHGGREGYDTEWRMDPEVSYGGELTDQGIHILDLFRWFMGEFNEAFAINTNIFWKKSPLEDNSFVLLKTKDGRIASAQLSLTQWKNKFLFEIFGKKGYLIIDGLGRSYGPERLIYGKREKLGQVPIEKIFNFLNKDVSWELEWKEFISAIKDNRQPLGNGYDGMKANELLAALYKAGRLHRAVKLGENDER